MKTILLVSVLAFAALPAFSQSATVTSSAVAGQTFTGTVNLVPVPQLVITTVCKQTTFVPTSGISGTAWSCTSTSNLQAPPNGSITLTVATTPQSTVSPPTPTIPAGGTTTTFTLQF